MFSDETLKAVFKEAHQHGVNFSGPKLNEEYKEVVKLLEQIYAINEEFKISTHQQDQLEEANPRLDDVKVWSPNDADGTSQSDVSEVGGPFVSGDELYQTDMLGQGGTPPEEPTGLPDGHVQKGGNTK